MILHKRRLSAKSCFVFLFCFCLSLSLGAQERYAKNSVLSNGHWVKIAIEKNGIYKLTNSELKKMGFDDPSKVAVYGYGGWPLEEDFSKPYVDDLPAVPVLRKDDYLLFYGRGTTKWEYKAMRYNNQEDPLKTFVHTNNPYSEQGYYFLTDGANPANPEVVKELLKSTSLRITIFDDHLLHEKDLASINKSGRKLYEPFLGNSKVFKDLGDPKDLGVVEGRIFVDCSFVDRINAKTGKNVTLSVDKNSIAEGYMPPASSTDVYVKGVEINIAGEYSYKSGENLNVKIDYPNSTGLNNAAHVDYIRLMVKRQLKAYNEPFTFFRSVESIGKSSQFLIEGADKACVVMDITDSINHKIIETELNGSTLSFIIPASSKLREFVLIRTDHSGFPVPVNKRTVECPNLHSLSNVDMVIIAPPTFRREAERLGKEHANRDGLRVEVIAPEDIYNEFSSGTPDATAYRRLMKMLYDKGSAEGGRPRYLLLFGDGAYDNRFVSTDWKDLPQNIRNNMLLTYQTDNSLTSESYVVDDYFGFLGDNTGKNIINDELNIGIGRFPVRTITEARNMVDKVISYMNNTVGDWKNKLCFIADDGNNSDSYATYHQYDADGLTEYLEKHRAEYISKKIFFDAFKKDKSGSGSYPAVDSLIQKTLKEGCFMVNYTGHGNTKSLSDENVITQNQIIQSTYKYLPIWITASCDFCRFDYISTTAGEDVFLNKNSGGIALFTTSRVAYADKNKIINKFLVENLFTKEYNSMSLGEILLETKKIKMDSRKLGFCLIGDPAMKLSYPAYKISLNVINGKDVSEGDFEFKSLDKVELEGMVSTSSGELLSDFNGILNMRVFDSRDTITTLGNNKFKYEKVVSGKVVDSWDSIPKVKYEDYLNTIFLGSDSIRNGKFKISFIVPKDISYKPGKKGKISMYAYESESKSKRDASGYFKDFSVFGTSDNPREDNTPPEIRELFLNDSTFVDGGDVNTTPYFYARVWDESGINITESSIGHGITLSIDNNPNTNFLLNSYYQNVIGSEGEGTVKFSISELAPGMHQAEFKIWDIMNNPTTYTFSFNVVEGLKPFISRLIATPTPAKGNVKFRLWHNRPETQMKVGILVYDITGRLHWKHEETGSSELFKDYVIDWDLRNNAGSHVRPGVYLYRAAISTNNSKEATETQKMIILW